MRIPGTDQSRVRLMLCSVVGLVLAVEAADGLRALRRRLALALSRWWDGVDRRSRRDAQRTELALVARWMARPHRT